MLLRVAGGDVRAYVSNDFSYSSLCVELNRIGRTRDRDRMIESASEVHVEVEREVMTHVRTVCARRNGERFGDRSRSRTDRATAVSARIFGVLFATSKVFKQTSANKNHDHGEVAIMPFYFAWKIRERHREGKRGLFVCGSRPYFPALRARGRAARMACARHWKQTSRKRAFVARWSFHE